MKTNNSLFNGDILLHFLLLQPSTLSILLLRKPLDIILHTTNIKKNSRILLK